MLRLCFAVVFMAPIMAQTDLWVSSQSGNGSNFIYLNSGNGEFLDSQQTLGNSLSLAAAFGDFDGDGDIDVVDAADPGAWVYLNDGIGNLTINQGFGGDLPITRSIAVADLDNDDDLDIILGVADSQFTSSSQVFLNDGSAQFSFKENIGTTNTRSIAVADLNGDTFPDLYEANQGEEDRIWINDGSGAFTDSGQRLNSIASFAVALADVENDGDLDALVAIDLAPNQIWINDGAGNFSASAQVFPASPSLACAFGDLDQDGDQDIVIGNDGALNSDQLEVWINDGSGAFTQNGQTSDPFRTVGLSLGDADGDGFLDLYLGNLGEDKIFRNNGSGIFTDTSQGLTSGTSNAGLLIHLRNDFAGAIAEWNQSYSILGLMSFQAQLSAQGDHRRGR